MRLDQLLAEVEEVVVRQSVDKADETISILSALTRALSSNLDRRVDLRSSLLRRTVEEAPHSYSTVLDSPHCEEGPSPP